MTVEEMKKIKEEKGYTYKDLERISGIPSNHIADVLEGVGDSFNYEYVIALEQIFENPDMISEEVTYLLDRQGNCTIEDYYALPDDKRVELIDGYIYDMASPNRIHQDIVVEIYSQIREFVKRKKRKCKVYISPLDIHLENDTVVVEPDLFIVCDLSILGNPHVYGAPDFIVEIISQSTKSKDYIIKYNLYKRVGVREYWIIDPYKRILTRHIFEDREMTIISGLDEPAPVGIYNGELEIYFNEILEMIDEYETMKD